jgi:heme exporter protein A
LQPFNFSGISATGVELWRGEKHVLSGVSLALRAGDWMHVSGPNGSGKTTLLRVVAGLLIPEQGRIEWEGEETRRRRDDWCAVLAYLAHSDGLKPEFTPRENLAFETGLRRRPGSGEIDKALDQLGLAAVRDLPAGFLSAGQRRRLAIARVLLAQAPFWILDEPYTNLDAAGVALVSRIIARHLDAGGAALVAAHQPPPVSGHDAIRLELAA